MGIRNGVITFCVKVNLNYLEIKIKWAAVRAVQMGKLISSNYGITMKRTLRQSI